MTPYSTGTVSKKRRGAAAVDPEDLLGEEGEGDGAVIEEEEEEGDDLEADTMIKVSFTLSWGGHCGQMVMRAES